MAGDEIRSYKSWFPQDQEDACHHCDASILLLHSLVLKLSTQNVFTVSTGPFLSETTGAILRNPRWLLKW